MDQHVRIGPSRAKVPQPRHQRHGGLEALEALEAGDDGRDYPTGRFILGYGTEDNTTALEFTHNWDRTEPYQHGTAWGHVAIAVGDIHAVCAELADAGVNITRPPGPMKHSPTVIAFIEDPDGYKIELIQRA